MARKNRKDKNLTVFLLALSVVVLIACSNSDDESGNPDPDETLLSQCLENGGLGNISENHGHSLTIPKEDILAAEEKTYDIQGFSDHTHTITLTVQDFTALKDVNPSRAVDIYTSTENDHRHSVIIVCAP
ncbi:hypothetical protein [Ulvibacterium sp.]|uniref:hypothetical protein n=1 Tax=Ulvibacterium sp. TaxID=2665914 RepID=UPI00262B1A2C|nr:hypothetical protein [Ulvibacterium sp.]